MILTIFKRVMILGFMGFLGFISTTQALSDFNFLGVLFIALLSICSVLLLLRAQRIYVPDWLYPTLEKQKIYFLMGLCLTSCLLLMILGDSRSLMIVIIIAMIVSEKTITRNEH